MDAQSLADWLVWIGKFQGLGCLTFGGYCCWKLYRKMADEQSELRWQLRFTKDEVRKWRDLYVATLDFKDPRKLFHGEDELGWDCRDTYDHAFCSHDCCADKDFCRAPEVDGARGYYKDVVGRDPTPPEGLWARLWWSRPSEIEAAKWRWDQRMAAIAAAKKRVYNLTIGPVLDLPTSTPGLAGWKPRQTIKEEPRRTEGTEVRWQGTTRPASPPDPSDGGQRRPSPGPVRR